MAVGTFRGAQPQKKVALSIFSAILVQNSRQMTIQSASIQTQQNPVRIMFPTETLSTRLFASGVPLQHFVQEVRAFGHSLDIG